MSICEATANSLTHSDYEKVEQLAGCDIGHKETSLGDSDDSDADSSSYCSSDEEFQMYPSAEFFHFRDVAEGDVIAYRPLQSYKVILKDECKPKDDSDLIMFYTNILEKIVDRRFVSQALHTVGCFGDFSALLTDDEHRKLCGLKEVANVSNVTYYMHLN